MSPNDQLKTILELALTCPLPFEESVRVYADDKTNPWEGLTTQALDQALGDHAIASVRWAMLLLKEVCYRSETGSRPLPECSRPG